MKEYAPDLFYPKWYLLQIYHIGLAPRSLLQELAIPPIPPHLGPFGHRQYNGSKSLKFGPKGAPRLVGRDPGGPKGFGGVF